MRAVCKCGENLCVCWAGVCLRQWHVMAYACHWRLSCVDPARGWGATPVRSHLRQVAAMACHAIGGYLHNSIWQCGTVGGLPLDQHIAMWMVALLLLLMVTLLMVLLMVTLLLLVVVLLLLRLQGCTVRDDGTTDLAAAGGCRGGAPDGPCCTHP